MIFTNLWSTVCRTFSAWKAHEAQRLAAALAFYTILSLAPLIILVIAVLALAFGHSSAQDQIISQVKGVVGLDGATAVRTMIEHAQRPASSISALIIGVMTLLFGASGVLGELRSALNIIWDVKPASSSGLAGLIKERLFSFGMVLATGFLLLISLVVSATLAGMGKFFGGSLPMPEIVLSAISFLISFAGTAILFALIFKYVPETTITWKDVRIGAIATAFFFTIGKSLIELYMGKAGVASAYGTAGSLIVVVVWVYYSSMIFFFGAEFTHELALPQERP